jgi:membrane protein required for colicin V production
MGLTALDILVLVLVGGGLVLGAIRGFVCEILSLFAWVAAILALSYFHAPATDFIYGPIGTWAGASMAAFTLVFGLVFLVGKLLSRRVGKRVRGSVVGPIDRVLGAGFGALKGLIGATLLYLAANLLYDTLWGRNAERPEWMAQSRTYPLLHASGEAIVDLVEARRGPERIERIERNEYGTDE